ncbi:hypothetical protein [Anaerococcus sp. Marseille-P3625]|uniref:hypothetical protein n=1 Tax=Anaerococcus sp. Marseille-P3625 TaxID=1977277 RepID=UPI000C06F514|nr:hypothetical protein [Anaerococcus sp. Marseille-P3625]
MKLSDVKEFLKFRRKFSKLEWEELNKCVDYQERKRADQIILNDSDIEEILNRIYSCSNHSVNIDIKQEKLSSDHIDLITKTIEKLITQR